MSFWLEVFASFLLVMGGLFILIGALGMVKLPDFYPRLQALEHRFHAGMDRIIADLDLNMVVPHHGARFNIVLGRTTAAQRYEDTFCHDRQVMLELIRACWERGVYFHDYGGPPVHHGYSIAHTVEDMDVVLNVLEDALKSVRPQLNPMTS